tara:strand:+ start:1091 stop:2536 length:1446 start_codon:yes stop_codon:yes gene_type:complete
MKLKIFFLIAVVYSPVFTQESLINIDFKNLNNDFGKYGNDTVKCEENLSIYTEFYKQKSFDSALESWLYLIRNAPKRTKNIYTHGATMFKHFIKNEKDSLKREYLISDLIMIYDLRNLSYPGQEGLVLGYKGSDIYKFRKSDVTSVQEAFETLKESFVIDAENSTARALNYYFASAAKLTSLKIMTKEDLIDLFSEVSSVIDYKEADLKQQNFSLTDNRTPTNKEKKQIKRNSSELKTLGDVRANMEKTLAPHVTCEKLDALYEPSFDKNKNDFEWLQRAAQLLRKNDCVDTDIYFMIAAQQYELNPTPKSAFNMGVRSLRKENFNKALEYFIQAVDGENDSIKKSDYLFYLAKTYYSMGQNIKSKKTALEAVSFRAGWGAPFILIGDLYAQSSRKCGENTGDLQYDEFTKRVGYWAAIEKYKYAKRIDGSSVDEANKKIKIYTEQMPDKTSTFQVIGLDSKTHTIDCWYKETVQNPYFSN